MRSIASHIDDPSVRFVEIDVSAAAYNAGHIPRAVLWNAYTDLRHSDYRPVSAAELQDLLRKSGVTPDMTVVFYGYGAHLGFWLLNLVAPSLYLLLNPDHLTGPVTRYASTNLIRSLKYTPLPYVCTFLAGITLGRLQLSATVTQRQRFAIAAAWPSFPPRTLT